MIADELSCMTERYAGEPVCFVASVRLFVIALDGYPERNA